MVIEIQVPDEWPPALGLAVSRLLRQALRDGLPVVVAIRQDASDTELSDAYALAREVIADAGLAA